MEALESSVRVPYCRDCGRVLRCDADEGRHTHDRAGENTLAKSTVPRRQRKAQVPVALGRSDDRRVTVFQISVESALESLDGATAILPATGRTQRYAIPEWLWRALESVLSPRQRTKARKLGTFLSGTVVYAAGRDVYKMEIISAGRASDPRCDQGLGPLIKRESLLRLATNLEKFYPGYAEASSDANVQADGTRVHRGSRR